jgi:hypothetical protein
MTKIYAGCRIATLTLTLTHLDILDEFAHDSASKPRLSDVLNDGWRQADEDNHEISHREVDNETVGDSVHVLTAPHHHTHQPVSTPV